MSHISKNSKTFCHMLVKKDLRWEEDEKCIAQSINFYSAKTYNYMRNDLKLSLPSKSSLVRWAPIKFLKPGLNNTLQSSLKEIVKDMDSKNKEVVLLIDEIAIKRGLQYNSHEDEIQGFVDDGSQKESRLSKYVCVFMLRGLHNNWKFVLSYYASATGLSSNKLKTLIEENINAAASTGLNVRAIVSDQGSNNRSCFTKCGITPEFPFFLHKNQKIYGVYDICHLIKSLRNIMMKNDIETPDGKVSWRIIKKLYEIDSQNSSTRLCPKLTPKHIAPGNFDKMKVKYATQIFSHTVSSAIRTLVRIGHYKDCENTALSTADFVEKINKLFDCLNSHVLYDKNPYRSALCKNNNIEAYLKEMKVYFQNIKYCGANTVFCIKGIILTIIYFKLS